MTIAGKTILVTGANRGIGRALVAEALNREVGLIYAATRQPLTPPDTRVVALRVDVTEAGVLPFEDLDLPGPPRTSPSMESSRAHRRRGVPRRRMRRPTQRERPGGMGEVLHR